MRIGTVLAWTSIGAVAATVLAVVPLTAKKAVAKKAPLPVVETVRAELVAVDKRLVLDGVFVLPQDATVIVGQAGASQRMKPVVKVGDKVKKGQVLASVDLSAPLKRLAPQRVDGVAESKHAEQLSDALGAALSSYESARAEARKQLAAAIEHRRSRVAEAKDQLDEALAAGKGTKARDAKASADVARQVYDRAKERSDKDQHAYDEGWISRNQATASLKVAEAARQVWQEAEARAAKISQGPSSEEALAAKAAYAKVKQAEDDAVDARKSALDAVEAAGLGMAGPTSVPTTFPSEAALAGKIASRAVLRAPIDGTVIQTEGQVVLMKPGAGWEFVAQIASTDVTTIRPRTEATYLWGGRGSVKAVGATDPRSGKTKIRLTCMAKPPVGASPRALVTIPGREQRIVLPSSSLVQGDPVGAVFTVENGVVHRRQVLYQARADGRIDVLQGIEAGTEVVVSGSRVLRDGVPVVLSFR